MLVSGAGREFARTTFEEYAALILNGQTIELVGGLDRALEPGDQLLLPGFAGG